MNRIISFLKKPYIGRAGRLQFLYGFLISTIFLFIGLVLAKSFQPALEKTKESIPVFIFFAILLVWFLYIMFISVYLMWGLVVRRLHDIGYSGWIAVLASILFNFSYIIFTLFFLSLLIIPSGKNSEKYGYEIKSLNLKNILFNKKNLDLNSNLIDKYVFIFYFVSIVVCLIFLILNHFTYNAY